SNPATPTNNSTAWTVVVPSVLSPATKQIWPNHLRWKNRGRAHTGFAHESPPGVPVPGKAPELSSVSLSGPFPGAVWCARGDDLAPSQHIGRDDPAPWAQGGL